MKKDEKLVHDEFIQKEANTAEEVRENALGNLESIRAALDKANKVIADEELLGASMTLILRLNVDGVDDDGDAIGKQIISVIGQREELIDSFKRALDHAKHLGPMIDVARAENELDRTVAAKHMDKELSDLTDRLFGNLLKSKVPEA